MRHEVGYVGCHGFVVAGGGFGDGVCGCGVGQGRAFVADYGEDFAGHEVAAAGGAYVGAEPVVGDGLVGVEDYVVALADSDGDGGGGVGFYGDEVGGYDLEEC